MCLRLENDEDASCPTCHPKLVLREKSLNLQSLLRITIFYGETFDKELEVTIQSRYWSQNLIQIIEEWLQKGFTSQKLPVVLKNARATLEGTVAEIEELKQSKVRNEREIELIKEAIADKA